MMTTPSEQQYKVEVYYDRPVFKAAYFEMLEEAESSAKESLGLDGSVREVRVLDHEGRIEKTLGRGSQ